MEPNDDNDAGVDPGRPRQVDRGDADLVAVMARLAAGDEAAVVTLFERYGGPISAAVQRQARHRGARVGRDDVEGLVFEVCDEIAKVAGAWRPRAARCRGCGHGTASPTWSTACSARGPSRSTRPAWPMSPTWPTSRSRVPRRTRAARCSTPSSGWSPTWPVPGCWPRPSTPPRSASAIRELWFEYQCEKHSGNASPAATVAPVFGMREATVRQAARRARLRLLRLIDSNERFAPLADLPLLA